MNHSFPYSVFLLALLIGSTFLVTALRAGSFGSGEVWHEKGSTGDSRVIPGTDPATGRQMTAGHLRYGMAGWWTQAGLGQGAASGGALAGEPPSLLVFDPRATLLPTETGLPQKAGAGIPGDREDGSVHLSPRGKAHQRQARKFKAYVARHAARFQIKPNLVFAIIKAESNFNTRAESTASAHGLMQLVPGTGGRAAYKMVYGEDVAPTREYLEDPDHNIELGTAYLRHLAQEYFKAVENADSREYCLIAAYNTGPGNVYRAFGGGYDQAMAKINSLSPPEVYDHLTRHLPYQETRSYLPKVVASRHEFVTL